MCRLSLDVMRVDSGDGESRHSVCYAAYGYMGDLMRQSERLRWLGPLRYTLAGAIVFLQGRSYSAHISCVPAPHLG
jgi:ceramide kinase